MEANPLEWAVTLLPPLPEDIRRRTTVPEDASPHTLPEATPADDVSFRTTLPYRHFFFNRLDPESGIIHLKDLLFSDLSPYTETTRLEEGTPDWMFKATLFKVTMHKGNPSFTDGGPVKSENVLLKVYGADTGTNDRTAELKNHRYLSYHSLAPPLLAVFPNGHAYKFVYGRRCSVQGISTRRRWRGIARELARWHTTLPGLAVGEAYTTHEGKLCTFKLHHDKLVASEPLYDRMPEGPKMDVLGNKKWVNATVRELNTIQWLDEIPEPISEFDIIPHRFLTDPYPNVWLSAMKWLNSLPERTEAELELKAKLRREFQYLVKKLLINSALQDNELVFGHGDLSLSNIIVTQYRSQPKSQDAVNTIRFVGYEHSTYCPAAFELANHFAEWAGFKCNHRFLPTKSIRLGFIREYVQTRVRTRQQATWESPGDKGIQHVQIEVDRLMAQVDLYRGFPGFYWGLRALVKAAASEDTEYAEYVNLRFDDEYNYPGYANVRSKDGDTDFDYAGYAMLRFEEYRAWKEEADGSRKAAGRKMHLREQRWAR